MLPHPKPLPLVKTREYYVFFVNITIITTSTFKAYYWGQFFFPDDGILLKKITVLFYVCKIYILYRFRFFLKKKACNSYAY